MKEFIKKYLGSFIRTGLAAGAGFLVAKGVVSQESATAATDSIASGLVEVISGALIFAVTQLWSLIEKKTGAKKPE
jgi:hypothetical protein